MREPEIDCIESCCQNRKHEASHLHDIGNGTEFAAWNEDIKRWEITVIVRVSHSTEAISLESNLGHYLSFLTLPPQLRKAWALLFCECQGKIQYHKQGWGFKQNIESYVNRSCKKHFK